MSTTRRIERKNRLGPIVAYIVLIILVVWLVFPVFWLTLNSFKSAKDLFRSPYTILFKPSIEAYAWTLTSRRFIISLRNSVLICFVTTALTLAMATAGAYAITRKLFRGHALFHGSVLMMYLFPPIVLAIPLTNILNQYGLTRTYWGLIIAYLTVVFPYCLWLLTGFLSTIPREVDEAAKVDGANRLGVFLRIILPLSLPGIATAAIFSFLASWNHFLYAFLIGSGDTKPLTGALQDVISGMVEASPMNYTLAFAFLTAAPAIVFFSFVQKSFIKGLAIGAVKG